MIQGIQKAIFMSDKHSDHKISPAFKMLVIFILKTIGVCLMIVLKIAGLLFTKIAELIEKSISHDKSH